MKSVGETKTMMTKHLVELRRTAEMMTILCGVSLQVIAYFQINTHLLLWDIVKLSQNKLQCACSR